MAANGKIFRVESYFYSVKENCESCTKAPGQSMTMGMVLLFQLPLYSRVMFPSACTVTVGRLV